MSKKPTYIKDFAELIINMRQSKKKYADIVEALAEFDLFVTEGGVRAFWCRECQGVEL